MPRLLNYLALLPLGFAAATSLSAQQAQSQVVYTNPSYQLTGIAAGPGSRLFINFPRWSDRYRYAVVQVSADGKETPYPNAEWNEWDGKPQSAATHFVCVQSVVMDSANTLWVVDAAAPLLTSPVPHGPKLVLIDVGTNTVKRTIPIGPDVALADSYLNDIRIDNTHGFAYLTDSGHGGLIVVNIKSGTAWRKLDNHPSVLADPKITVTVSGQALKQPNGKPGQFNADSLELAKDGSTVYYKAINSNTLWSVPTSLLQDRNADAASGVKAAASNLFPTDGLWLDSKGRVYLSDVEHFAVQRVTPGGKPEKIFQSDRLSWPDTFTEDAAGNIYITASRLDRQPRYNQGLLKPDAKPFEVFKLSNLDPH